MYHSGRSDHDGYMYKVLRSFTDNQKNYTHLQLLTRKEYMALSKQFKAKPYTMELSSPIKPKGL